MMGKQLLLWLLPRLAWTYLQCVGKTSRILWSGTEHVRRLQSLHTRWIYAFWHGRQVFFLYSHRRQPICTMVSRSRDGEWISRVITCFGMRFSRGSSSRAGAPALREMVQWAARGFYPSMTPDGPRGPARQVKPGVLYLAQKLGWPILPIANGMRRKLIFRGWDDYWVPLPFNRVSIVCGDPLWISQTDSLEERAQELKRALDEVTEQADRNGCG